MPLCPRYIPRYTLIPTVLTARVLSADVLTQSFASTPPLMKEPTITIKPAADKKDKKDKVS